MPLNAVYFVLLTLINILNLVLFRVGSIAAQSSAASLGQAVTMIMSQRIILSLHDWGTPPSSSSRQGAGHNIRFPGSGGLASGGNHELQQFPPTFPSPGAVSPTSMPRMFTFRDRGNRGMDGMSRGNADPLKIQVDIQDEVKHDYEDSVFTVPSRSTVSADRVCLFDYTC